MTNAGKVLLLGVVIMASIIAFAIVTTFQQHHLTTSDNCHEQVTQLRFSLSSNDKHPIYFGAKKFKELVESRTSLTVELYPSAQLGDDRAAIEMLQLGTLDISIPSTGPLANFYSEYNVFDLPFMIKSEAVADQVLRSQFAKDMLERLESKQLIGLDFWENGFRHLTNSTRAVHNVEDVDGLKIRTMESALHLDAWHALGAIPTPMAFKELFTALQQGTVDGQENPYPNIALNNLYEVQRYISDTGHVYTPLALIFSAKTWYKLSKKDQAIIKQAAIEAGNYQRDINRKINLESLSVIEQHMQLTKLSPQARLAFQQATISVVEKYQPLIGDDVIEYYKAAIAQAELQIAKSAKE